MALFSFHNEARDAYRHARKMTDLLVKAGKVRPEGAESAFRERVAKQMKGLGLPLPKAWKAK
jgi:hypothetical protein